MALSPRLDLRQGQGLVITPQLQQAIKLLQLSNLELEAYVEAELERNPLLQREDRDSEAEIEAPQAESGDYDADQTPEAAAAADLDVGREDLYDGVSPGEVATGDAAPAGPGQEAGGLVDWSRAGRGGGFEEMDGEREARPQALTLPEHLEAQLAVAGLSEADRAIALVLIDAVDEGGYLRAEAAEIAERLGCALVSVERRLRLIRRILSGK